MKILFLTNFYPPASRGGYEQWCQEVADGLTKRGHDILVLASSHGKSTVQDDPIWVRRELYLEMEFASLQNALHFFTARKKRENENLVLLRKTIADYKPDIVLIWGMWNLSRSLSALAEAMMPGRVAYYVGDYWPTLPDQFENYWNASPRNFITGLPKLLLKPIAQQILAREKRPVLKLEHVMFPSTFMMEEFKRKGISPRNVKIVHGGIDTRPYLDGLVTHHKHLSLLYIGRLTHEKGVHTTIESLGQLVHEHNIKDLTLTIVGDGESDYMNHLHQLVEDKRLVSFVNFLPVQPKDALPVLYRAADVFLFTSIWPEPFGRVIVEAMASGVAVIGTSVGGASEILVDGDNALVFSPDNPSSLTQQVMRLIETPALREQLIASARETAVNKFDIQRMTAEIESYLQTMIK
ncbi:MAG: glycosyltransferase family 4 protein [Anaerolineales bacterium]|nr:glycosyltransferase family 4 protein [Anaerolineales bacterium]